MIINIPSYKHIAENQQLNLTNNNISTLIGGNGAGKSTLLESIFSNYIDKENELRADEEIYNLNNNLRCIAFSSGQNELFSEIFNNYDKNAKRYKREDSQTMRSFYFDYWWSRLLVFFATSLKPDGLVKSYLQTNNYIDCTDGQDISSHIIFNLRVRQPIVNKIIKELEKEATGEYIENPLYRSLYIQYLEKLINNTINEEYDFTDVASIKRIVSTSVKIDSKSVESIFGENTDEIFTFISRASSTWLSNFSFEDIEIYFKNDLEFGQLSDGEYQLLSIYAMIDLFDTENTIFLLDEIDSHLHYKNINILWDTLKNINGKVVTTTHISESILNNDYSSISYIESGKIINDLVPKKILEKLSNVVNQEKFIYQLSSKLNNLVLIDDESDWEIFKELAKIKIGNEVLNVLNQITPIKEGSGWNYESQLFGSSKIEFVKKIKEYSVSHTINLQNIFMVCDNDEYGLFSVNPNMECKKTPKLFPHINEIEKFNNNQTKSYLLSWRRREILHYMISYSMLKEYNKLDELRIIADYVVTDSSIHKNFDNDKNIKTTSKDNVKFIKLLMCKENGNIDDDNWTDYDKIKEVIAKIPPEEISEDIVKMFQFIKTKVES